MYLYIKYIRAEVGKYKNAVIDHVSVDEILLLLVKGERV